MHSPYIQVSDVLRYKLIPIIYRTSVLQNSLEVINKLINWNFLIKMFFKGAAFIINYMII